jgi:UDP-N-acetylglucosamine pyrophosphorylase
LDDFQDISRHGYFNTNNIWINLPKLKQILNERNNMLQLPMIRNSKSLDPRDSKSPAVYQLETAMGAALEVFPGAEVLQVERSRFMPVKTCQDLLVVRSDIYSLDEQFHLALAPERRLGAPVVELDGRYFKLIDDFEQRIPEPPSLIDCAQLTVKGDVAFAPGLVLRGEVSITNASDQQRTLKAEAPLADQAIEL